jgi:hypothetical protein
LIYKRGLIGCAPGLDRDGGVHRRGPSVADAHRARLGKFLRTLIHHACALALGALRSLARPVVPIAVPIVELRERVGTVAPLRFLYASCPTDRRTDTRAIQIAVVVTTAQVEHHLARAAADLAEAVVDAVAVA